MLVVTLIIVIVLLLVVVVYLGVIVLANKNSGVNDLLASNMELHNTVIKMGETQIELQKKLKQRDIKIEEYKALALRMTQRIKGLK